VKLLPPPWNVVASLVLRGIGAAADATSATQAAPAAVSGAISGHMDVIGVLLGQIEKNFPAIKPFADALSQVKSIPPAPAQQ
jgi:hypothetical protein